MVVVVRGIRGYWRRGRRRRGERGRGKHKHKVTIGSRSLAIKTRQPQVSGLLRLSVGLSVNPSDMMKIER